jgi:hypothetical protein
VAAILRSFVIGVRFIAIVLSTSGCSLIFPSDGYEGGTDLEALCSSEDVVRCFGFDSQAEVDALYVSESCVNEPVGQCHGVVDLDVKHSGEGALRFVVPATPIGPAGSDDVGAFDLNFSPDTTNEPRSAAYPIQFDVGSSFYVSWAQRIDAQMLDEAYETSGWYALTVGPGDQPTGEAPYYSAMALGVGNTLGMGIPQVGGTLYDPAQGCRITDATTFDSQNRLLVQNAVGCAYERLDPGCFFYAPDAWQRFELGVHFGGFMAELTRVEPWAANDGGAPVKLIDLEVGVCEPPAGESALSYGKAWLPPGMPNRMPVARDAFIWYDDLVISRAPTLR